MTPLPMDLEFARFAGELAESFAFNRSLGQIYGLLFVSGSALSLDDIAKRLNMSKGNASINLRVLEAWGAVRPVWVSGSRKDFYEAERDLKSLTLRRVQEGFSKRLDSAEERLSGILSRLNGHSGTELSPELKKRLKELQSMVASARRAMRILPKAVQFLLK